MSRRVTLSSFAVTLLVVSSPVLADDGASSATNDDGGVDVDTAEGDGSAASDAFLACDGALCDTTNGSQCDVVQAPALGTTQDAVRLLSMGAALGLVGAGAARRRRTAGARRPSTDSRVR